MQRFSCVAVALIVALALATGLRGEDAPLKKVAAPSVTSAPRTQAALPAEVDLRPELLKYDLGPRRQGRRNTCSVFTTAAAMEFALSKAEGRGEKLSVEYLNWACNQVIENRTQDRGQFFRDLLKGYDRYGVCSEVEMPYRRRFDPEASPSEAASKQAKAVRERDFQVNWICRWREKSGLTDEQMQEIHRVLASGYPVAAGASHSRLLVGYRDDAKEPGGGVFLTKDSGSGSFASVSYEFVRTEVNDVFWVESPERKPKPGQ